MTPLQPHLVHNQQTRSTIQANLLFGFICLLAASALPVTAAGQTIVNPSFEADAVPPFPGYGAITGWTGGSGINDSAGPFNYNSTIPDGQKVAFIQGAGTMRQTVSGFIAGAQYRLRYFENARDCCGPRTVNLQVTAGGVTVVPTHEVLAVGESNPYVQKTSETFTASAASLEIAFITSGSGDFTVLLDKVKVSKIFVVTNNADSGAGSLRQTVLDAPAGSTITFSEAGRGTISLTTGRIVIDKSLTIAGPGADLLTIRNAAGEGSQNNVIDVNVGVTAVLLSDLTISDGYADGGAGIYNRGNLTVRNAVIRDNRLTGGGAGGGILSEGTLTLANSVVTGNGEPESELGYYQNGISQAGGIYFIGASLTITDSAVSGNLADVGGGIYAGFYSSVTITNSTIRNNESSGRAGGLYLDGGMATLTNCTVSQNLVYNGPGGGIYINYDSTLTLINTTIANNTGDTGGGISNFLGIGTVNARNSIIAENLALGSRADGGGKDFDGPLTSQGYNLIGNTSGMQIVGNTTGNILGANPRLGPLDYYGGPTQTHALLTGSPAINTGNTATSPATDQRGAARLGTADIGAFEVNNSANVVIQLPDGFNQHPYDYTVADFETFVGDGVNGDNYRYSYTVTGGALPPGFLLSTTFSGSGYGERENVKVIGTTSQTGVFNFSVTAANMQTGFSVVIDYRLVIGYRNPNPASCMTFFNTASILIPGEGPAAPYPSNIGVAGLGGTVTNVTVTLTNITHYDPADISILLVGPSGERVLLMSYVGAGGGSLSNATYTFDDAAAAKLNAFGLSPNGSYKPSGFSFGGPFPPPAPAETIDDRHVNHRLMSVFNGTAPNGVWSLYVVDSETGGGGAIYGGWSLNFTTTNCVGPTPTLTAVSAASRKTHGSAGIFDLDLPLTGGVAVESRSGGVNGTHTLLVRFANPLTSVGGAVVTGGTGSVSSSQIGSDTHEYVINLTAPTNAQRLTVTLNNVTDSSGYNSSAIPVTLGLLVGDANGDGAVNSGDAIFTRNRSGQITDATNFPADYNLDGVINSGDASVVRSRSGQSIP